MGFAEAVEAIEAHAEAGLVIGFVDDQPRGGCYFQVFLSSDLSEVVACLAVSRR